MPPKSIEPLKKITVDLFLADVEYLRAHSENFSEEIREAVRDRAYNKRRYLDLATKRKTLGDLNA